MPTCPERIAVECREASREPRCGDHHTLQCEYRRRHCAHRSYAHRRSDTERFEVRRHGKMDRAALNAERRGSHPGVQHKPRAAMAVAIAYAAVRNNGLSDGEVVALLAASMFDVRGHDAWIWQQLGNDVAQRAPADLARALVLVLARAPATASTDLNAGMTTRRRRSWRGASMLYRYLRWSCLRSGTTRPNSSSASPVEQYSSMSTPRNLEHGRRMIAANAPWQRSWWHRRIHNRITAGSIQHEQRLRPEA